MLIITLRNISELAPISDYEYKVYVNNRKIAEGTVVSHQRDEGWEVLVGKLADYAKLKRDHPMVKE